MRAIELIEGKINEGKAILREIGKMRPTSGIAMNVAYFVSEDVGNCRNVVEKWQLTSKDILISLFGETHRYVATYAETMTKKDAGYNYQEEFTSEVNRGLSVLESILESLQLGIGMDKKDTSASGSKTPMVFISHSSKDKDFANALVTLLEDIGFDNSNMFCSSVEGYGIALNKDIFKALRSLFNEHHLYVIFIHSPRYYRSPVSLNEMGAAWVLKTGFCSLLTTDMEFDKMTGVVNDSTISIKVDAEDAPSRLTELKNDLIQLFGLPSIDETKWERKRKVFLNQVLSISYGSEIGEDKRDAILFSDEELQIFSKWANNLTDSTYMARWSRQGLEVHFGYQNGYTFPRGEAFAQYEDFMERLQQAGYIVSEGMSNKVTQYRLTKQGYDFAKTMLKLKK